MLPPNIPSSPFTPSNPVADRTTCFPSITLNIASGRRPPFHHIFFLIVLALLPKDDV
ncbi:hypothetical protein BJX76DRAFT_341545 [Aspergillus varians]